MKNLPIWMTTVTPVSKIIAAVLFISLPFAGFFLGISLPKTNTTLSTNNSVVFTTKPVETTMVTPTQSNVTSANSKTYHYDYKYLQANLLEGYSIKETIVTDNEIKSGLICTNGNVNKYEIDKSNAQYIDIYYCSNSNSSDLIAVARSFFSHEYPKLDGKDGSPKYIENSAKAISELGLNGYTGSFIDYGFITNFDILGKNNVTVLIQRGGYDTPWNGVQVGMDEYNKLIEGLNLKL